MTDLNEDRTVAFTDQSVAPHRGNQLAGLGDVPRARLVCTDRSQVESALPGDGIIHLVPGAEQTIGRGETCTYPIGSRKLSRQHARIFPGVSAWGVEDLNSTNGVRVNDDKVQTAWLKHGDVVRFGPIPFRFELERPNLGGTTPLPAAPGLEGEHTMIFTGAEGARAAEVMLKAVREAEKTEEPPAIVPTTPNKKTVAAPTPAAGGNPRWVFILAALAVVVVVAGVVIYSYPAFVRSQKIAAIVTPDVAIVQRVIDRVRDTAGTPTEAARLDDIKLLQPVINDAGTAIDDGYADSRKLTDLYARSRFLVFEREFVPLFTHPDPNGEFLKEAGRKAFDLRTRLDKIGFKLPPLPAGVDQDPLKAAADLADLARILVDYRTFARQFPQVGKTGLQPTVEQLNTADERKAALIKYRHLYNEVLGSDYRLFNTLVHDVENNDVGLVGRWRDFLASGQ